MIVDPSDFWGPYHKIFMRLVLRRGAYYDEGYGPYNSVIQRRDNYMCECGHVCEEDESIMEFNTWYGEDGYAFYIMRCIECGTVFEVTE